MWKHSYCAIPQDLGARAKTCHSSFWVMYFPKEEPHARFRAADFCIPIDIIMDCVNLERTDDIELDLPDLDLDKLLEDM